MEKGIVVWGSVWSGSLEAEIKESPDSSFSEEKVQITLRVAHPTVLGEDEWREFTSAVDAAVVEVSE